MTNSKGGKVFLVTGAASGIGTAIARLAISSGNRVTLADINLPGARRLARELGPAAYAVGLDVRSSKGWERALNATYSHFGTLDVLVNNAGVVRPGLMGDVPIAKHRETMDINYYGPMRGIRAVLPRFRKQGSGHIATVCSLSAFCVYPMIVTYGASKAALRALHIGYAFEERNGPVHFTIVHPTATETPMLEYEAREGVAVTFALNTVQPEDVAQVLMKAIKDKKLEVSVPLSREPLAKALGADPQKLMEVVERNDAIGRDNIERRLKSERKPRVPVKTRRASATASRAR